MRWVLIGAGGLATAAALLISMSLNFLFGASLGQTPTKQWLFGGVSVIADLWKGIGPVFIAVMWHERHRFMATAACCVWLVCFLYAVSCALGVAAQDRTIASGEREAKRAKLHDAQQLLGERQAERAKMGPHRHPVEIEGEIDAVLARAVRSGDRVRGTVDGISGGCNKVDVRTVEPCAEIASLRKELLIAQGAAQIDASIEAARREIVRLREQGHEADVDPQAELLSKLSRGWMAPRDISLGLTLGLVAVLELVSAFGFAVISAYARATRKRHNDGPTVTPPNDKAGSVLDFMAARIEPAGSTIATDLNDMYNDYLQWCSATTAEPLSSDAFVAELDLARGELGLQQKVRKFGTRYYGVRLRTQKHELGRVKGRTR